MAAKKPPKLEVVPPSPAMKRAIIRRLMEAGDWQTGKTGRRLAQEWRCTAYSVRWLACQVSKELRRNVTDEARERVLQVFDEAEDIVRDVIDAGDPADRDEAEALNVKLRAAKALSDIARARADAVGLARPVAHEDAEDNTDEPPFGFKKTSAVTPEASKDKPS